MNCTVKKTQGKPDINGGFMYKCNKILIIVRINLFKF